MGLIVDPYSEFAVFAAFHPVSILLTFEGYFDRYKNMKILQIQSSGDEFFLPDNEVCTDSIIRRSLAIFSRMPSGMICKWPPVVRTSGKKTADTNSNRFIIDLDDYPMLNTPVRVMKSACFLLCEVFT